jgi:phytanoyl-CoA hydroxylase
MVSTSAGAATGTGAGAGAGAAAGAATPEGPLAEAIEEAVEEALQEGASYDPYGPSETPEHLFDHTGFAPWIEGLDAVDEAQVAAFREQGYLVVHNAFSPEEIDAALEGLLDLIGGRSLEFVRSKGIQFETRAKEILPTLTREQRQDYVRKLNQYVNYDARLKAMSEHPALLGVVSRLLGGAPPELFANQALLKPPLIGREKPWHQDHAFFNVPMGTPVVGVWIALDEALLENGCMHIIPAGHREPIVHFKRRDWQICDDQVPREEILAVPLKPGGLLFFDGLLPHGTPPTRSPRRRRALQFHYIPDRTGRIAEEERMAVFGGEGRGVTC